MIDDQNYELWTESIFDTFDDSWMAQVCLEECEQNMDVDGILEVVKAQDELVSSTCSSTARGPASQVTDNLWMGPEDDMCGKDSLEVASHDEPVSVSKTPTFMNRVGLCL